jgi:hypothetical protein
MKPARSHELSVGVWPVQRDHSGAGASLYNGIYTVTLNGTVQLDVIPQVDRSPPWPPVLPDNVDLCTTPDEARRITLLLARYAITPASQDSVEIVDDVTIFDINGATFAQLSTELEVIAGVMTGVHDSVDFSELQARAPVFERFLRERFLVSDRILPPDLAMLGR